MNASRDLQYESGMAESGLLPSRFRGLRPVNPESIYGFHGGRAAISPWRGDRRRMKNHTYMNVSNHGKLRTGIATAIAALVLAVGLPLSGHAQSSTTGQTNSQEHANSNANLGVNAPLPEPATWVGIGTLVGLAATLVLLQRRRKAA
jgi:hypothetical protein